MKPFCLTWLSIRSQHSAITASRTGPFASWSTSVAAMVGPEHTGRRGSRLLLSWGIVERDPVIAAAARLHLRAVERRQLIEVVLRGCLVAVDAGEIGRAHV